MTGRPSKKKQSLLKTYRFLRASMMQEDAQQLKKDYPDFAERDEDSTDIEIQVGIETLVDTMSKVSPPDYENREPIH